MKTRKTTFILLLLGMLIALPIKTVTAQNGDQRKVFLKTGKKTGKRLTRLTILNSSSNKTAISSIKVEITRVSDKSPQPLISNFTVNVTGKDDNGSFIAEREFTCIKDNNCLFRKNDKPIGESYKLEIILLDKNGKPIGKSTTSTVVVEELFTATVKSVKLYNKGKKGSMTMNININTSSSKTSGQSDDIVDVKISRITDKSPKPLISHFKLKIIGKAENGDYIAQRIFDCSKGDCLFSKDENPIGETYKITMVVLNSKEEVISKTKTTEVKVKISEECKTKYSLHHMSLSGFDFYSHYSEENKSEYPLIIKRKGSKINIISIPVTYKVNPKDQATFGVSSVTLSVRDSRTSNSNSESSVLTINSIYNEKTKALEANWPDIDSVLITSTKITTSICGYKVKTHEINFNKIESVQGDEIHFKLKKGKETTCDNKDSTCTASLTLSEDITLKSSITGSFQTIAIDGVSVTQKDKALSDLEVEAIVEMKSCKEASIYVAIPLKYNDKTGTYANSKALALCNKAGMTVLSMDVVAKGKDLPVYKWTHVAFTHTSK